MENPYASPDSSYVSSNPQDRRTPGVVVWFRLFSGALAAFSLLIVVAGVAVVAMRESLVEGDGPPAEFWLAYGAFLIVVGFGTAGAYGFGTLMPPRRWTWVFGIILIALTMASCCLPVAVPLLIFWGTARDASLLRPFDP